MASKALPIPPGSTVKDHLFSLNDGLKKGRPPPSIKNICTLMGGEPAPETIPTIDPATISRCCIEKGLFPVVPLFFQYPCGITKGWSEWVESELANPVSRDILRRTEVLDAIFLSRKYEIRLEVELLRHVVRRWSTDTHTFMCSWGEFTPTLEDVANLLHLPVSGNQDPFNILLAAEDKERLYTLRKGAPISSSQSLRFSNWVRHFGNQDKENPCRLPALLSMWLGKFVFCDFHQDLIHDRVFPMALSIARGDVIPLAPMFLGHLYRLLDQVHFLEKGVAGSMALETLLNSSFLQVFLWERIKGLNVSPLSFPQAKALVETSGDSYMPKMLPLTSRWFKRRHRKGQDFLELLDNIENFIFRPYTMVPKGFEHVSFYGDLDGVAKVPTVMASGVQLKRNVILNVASLPLPTFGDNHSETSVYYSPHRVKLQHGLDQGVPLGPGYHKPSSMHKFYWNGAADHGREFAFALADKGRAGSFSKSYRVYWNRCFASFNRFHTNSCARLLPSIDRHPRLVPEDKAIYLSEKRNLTFTSRSGKIVGKFPSSGRKTYQHVSCDRGKSSVREKRKQEANQERGASKKPKKFMPKVVAIGSPKAKKELAAPIPKHAQCAKSSVTTSNARVHNSKSTKNQRVVSQPQEEGLASCRNIQKGKLSSISEDNDGAEGHGDSGNNGSAGCINNEINDNGAAKARVNKEAGGDGGEDFTGLDVEDTIPAPASLFPAPTSPFPALNSLLPAPTSSFPASTSSFPASTSPFPAPTSLLPASTSSFPASTSSFPAPTSPFPAPNSLLPASTSSFPASTCPFPAPNSLLPASTSPFPAPTSLLPASTSPFPAPTSLLPASTSPFPASNSLLPASASPFPAPTTSPHNVGASWEHDLNSFIDFFDSDVRILRSTDELLPLHHVFHGYETFRGAQIFPETMKALSRFF